MGEVTTIDSMDRLKALVGEKLGSSEWVTIGQERIDAFADATGDQQWIHVDVERARRESPFGGPIAHGYLTISLAPVLLPQIMQIEGLRLTINYGIDKMRMTAPVPSGARMRMHATLKHVRQLPGGGARTTITLSFEVEGVRKPACVADVIYIYYF